MDNDEIYEKYMGKPFTLEDLAEGRIGKAVNDMLNSARLDSLDKAKKFTFKIDFGRAIGDEEMAEISGWMNQVVEQHNKFIDKLKGETNGK